MSFQDFSKFFSTACGQDRQPYDYQRRLAEADCASRLITVPTGLGKTAAVVLAWLWNRAHHRKSEWPRRIVYCLPMRTLVEQTRGEAEKWIAKLDADKLLHGKPPKVIILMGGEELEGEAKDWDLHPEDNAILIGTQDMLLSRALNRGYGMSRYRWPMHFGLLNNDCLWVMDETQLMGPGLATGCQLEAFRLPTEATQSVTRLSSFPGGRSVTWYASATGNPEHLKTRDWRGIDRPEDFTFGLSKAELGASSGPVAERLLSNKKLRLAEKLNFGSKLKAPDQTLIADIVKEHQAMVAALAEAPKELPRRSLVICNTVDRAVAVHRELQKSLGQRTDIDLMLMHSRFRPEERKEQATRLKADHLAMFAAGQIIVATQVIEAGVDLSSGILWTEIAPLASLVQRLGRLNRSGEFGFAGDAPYGFTPLANVIGIDCPDPDDTAVRKTKEQKDEEQKKADSAHLPYARGRCKAAWAALPKLKQDASPTSLVTIRAEVENSIERCPYSLQRHELLDFFDTDANLSLGFTDVSPFVRGLDDDTDVYLLWRDEWQTADPSGKPDLWPDYQRNELCAVPISKTKDARSILNQGWMWRGKDSGWISVRAFGDVAPGMTILLPTSAGGYDKDSGWTGKENDKVESCYDVETDGPSDDDMLSYLQNGWRSIETHTLEVIGESHEILGQLNGEQLGEDVLRAFSLGIPWHDIGKNHEQWQTAANKAVGQVKLNTSAEPHQPLAKFSLAESPELVDPDGKPKFTGAALKREVRRLRNLFKPGMAHEVASALAFRQHQQQAHGARRPMESLLAEYLIMSHHGHVRKVLRDELPKFRKVAKDEDEVRGISEGDPLPAVTIAGQTLGGSALATDCRRMGRDQRGHESYTRSVLRLLEHYGPFRLAYFEALFRAADMRASKFASEMQSTQPSSL